MRRRVGTRERKGRSKDAKCERRTAAEGNRERESAKGERSSDNGKLA
jgi:hypothetical protein